MSTLQKTLTNLPASFREERVLRIQPPAGWPTLGLRELWERRELLGFFIWRDVTVRYKQTLLGIGWAVVQPLATMIVFSVVFGRLAHLDSDGAPYAVFSLAGLLPWMLFANGLAAAANSLVGNVNLISKVYFPRLLLPLANVLAGLVDLVVAFVVLLAVMAWYGLAPSWRMLWLPVPIAMSISAALGAGLWLGAAHARYRDVRHLLPFLVQLWMYCTPVVYAFSILPERWRIVAALIPLVGAVECFRACLLRTSVVAPQVVVVSTLASGLMLASGLWYFRATERVLVDTI